jgi:osmotically-inducible protein OsmY
VSVDTVNQQVTLHGTVRSAEEKAKTETVVKTITGVQGVRNLLQVVAPEHEKAVQHLEAAVVARSTGGVCSVQDDLRIAD